MKQKLLAALALGAAAWLAFGGWTWSRRAARTPAVPGEARGAWHVHTTRSDGRGTLAEVVRAAREAGLQFVVLADHNVLSAADAGYHDGVLVVLATEISSRFGHVVAVGLGGPPGDGEKADPLGGISAAGGAAVLAHPLHPARPFTGWGTGEWRGLEVVSNDAAWYQALHERAVGRILRAALALPFDAAQAVLHVARWPEGELARFDAEGAAAAAAGRPLPALLCSADAHGYPGYRAAFEAFSMHVPVPLTGDATADTRAVVDALLGVRSAACVFDGVAPARAVGFGPSPEGGLALDFEAPSRVAARVRLLRDGRPIASRVFEGTGSARVRFCSSGCEPGTYRAEVTLDGRGWIFTNPVALK